MNQSGGDGRNYHDRSPCTQLLIKCTMHIKMRYETEFLAFGNDNFSARMSFVRNKLQLAGLDFKTEIREWTKIRPGGKSSEALRYVRDTKNFLDHMYLSKKHVRVRDIG